MTFKNDNNEQLTCSRFINVCVCVYIYNYQRNDLT